MTYRIREFVRSDGTNPFRQWLDSLDNRIKARVQIRVLRVEQGNLGDFKSVGGGVYEFRFHHDAGVRVYFGKAGRNIILLLVGGNKASQSKDIRMARLYWDLFQKGN